MVENNWQDKKIKDEIESHLAVSEVDRLGGKGYSLAVHLKDGYTFGRYGYQGDDCMFCGSLFSCVTVLEQIRKVEK